MGGNFAVFSIHTLDIPVPFFCIVWSSFGGRGIKLAIAEQHSSVLFYILYFGNGWVKCLAYKGKHTRPWGLDGGGTFFSNSRYSFFYQICVNNIWFYVILIKLNYKPPTELIKETDCIQWKFSARRFSTDFSFSKLSWTIKQSLYNTC